MKAAVLLTTVLVTSTVHAGDWPGWRGPNGNGIAPEGRFPTEWSEQEGVRWKVPLPSGSNSSPIVHGDRVFVTAAEDDGRFRGLYAYRRTDGKRLWRTGVEFTGKESTHRGNPYCSATPVTDGRVVCASFGSAGLVGVSVTGELLWKVNLGPLEHVFGNASSPILFDDLCVLWCGPGRRQFVLAVDVRTGEERWRFDVPGGKPDYRQPSDCVGSWATPVLVEAEGRTQLVVPAPEQLVSLDPKTGERLWFARGPGKLAYASPVVWNDLVVLPSGFHGPMLGVRTNGRGDVTRTHVAWTRRDRQPQQIGSPVVVGDKLVRVTEGGVAEVLDPRTGLARDDGRDRVTGQTWGSLAVADGRFYVCSLKGEVVVFDEKLEIVSRNQLDDRIGSAPAFSDGDVFVRGFENLYCISDESD